MTILFLILTTKANASTRQRWQKETWLKDVDYVYLDEPVGEEIYNNAPKKYIEYLRKSKLAHDWYFFCDDDTFVFVNKLKQMIRNDHNDIMIGFKGGEFMLHNLRIQWCSGGAGILMNHSLVNKIKKHLQNNNPVITHETDISLAIWAAMSSNFVLINNRRFSPFRFVETPMKDCITYHYCNEGDFKMLANKL